ncbi:hypothetical protein J0A78_21290 [Providencia rettgeri]|uniref:hypothetical protein n=2 Tax=Providencia rettgeri TaxID=587 RepID=UPI0019D49826|nr:hypothetical protein [Providencia rettgeri]MBN7844197.1 hypothetical protein [Providencia rettgeri]MBN7856336.1 hypothetical protein [Providencia rettgeri]MBN7864061.1 hypothetical protein [Providencia rettgeri]MBN7898611.1 hypothetical protein [Providencia rettgeri]MBN7923698.1 hypothetical protein [Providencia rettgeri]
MKNNPNQKEKLENLLRDLDDSDKIKFYFSCLEGDLKKQHEISKKYGYTFEINLERSLKDEFIDIFLSMPLKHAKNEFSILEKNLISAADIAIDKKMFIREYDIDNISELSILDYEITNSFLESYANIGFTKKMVILKQAHNILSSAGCKNTAKEIMELFKIELCDIILGDLRYKLKHKEMQSQKAKENASKPRHQYYEEVMSVIKATWDKYPNASQTGIHDALCSHYYGKVSRNALNTWITKSGLRPPKPKKYSSFQLVFPPIAS